MLAPPDLYPANKAPGLNNVRDSYRPAVSLTRSLPQGVGNAEVLALGSSYLRDVLYTAYHEKGLPQRTVHITLVDSLQLDAVLNTVLLTLVHKLGSNVNEAGLADLWEILSYPYIGKTSHKTILQHLQALKAYTASLETWKSSTYGDVVRFEDETTLGFVSAYLTAAVSNYESSPGAQRQAIAPNLNQVSQHEEVNRFAASASPLAQQARADIWESTRGFFTTGVFSQSKEGKLPNPLYITGSNGIVMPENPLMGFHLATGYTPLTEMSPLRPELSDASDDHKSLASAKVQFTEWVLALRGQLGSSLTFSLVVADPLAYCDSLQRLAAGEQRPGFYRMQDEQRPGFYRMQDSADALDLSQGSVTEFDMIEASNITGNRIRTLLTLASAAPLLKNEPWATIYTEFNIRMGEMRENPLEDILFVDIHAISTLLGVGAAEMVTNSTSTSIVDDVLLGVENKVPVGNQTSPVYYRLSWKHNSALSGEVSPLPMMTTAEHLVDLLIALDEKMYVVDQRYAEDLRSRGTSPPYRLGLLAPLIKAASRHIEFPVAEACSKFLDTVNRTPKRSGIPEELHDLTLQLHLRGLYSASYLADPVSPDSRETQAAAVATVAAVSVVVGDRARLESFFGVDTLEHKSIAFEARVVHSKGKVEIFRDLQLMTVESAEVTGPGSLAGFSQRALKIQKSQNMDENKLIVLSFWVPIALLVNEEVEFQLLGLPYPLVESVYGITVCRGNMVDELASSEPHFILTPDMPSSGEKRMACIPDPAVRGPVHSSQNLGKGPEDSQGPVTLRYMASDKASTLVARQNFGSVGRKLLADKVPIVIKQSGPCSLDVVFAAEDDLFVYTLRYPSPVTYVGVKSRVARTSGYIEVIAPFASHTDTPALSDIIFPSTLSSTGTPVPLNLPHVNLDNLPALDLSSEAAIKWIVTLTSFQFSSKEREERGRANEETGMTQSNRVNFKESLFSMFMATTGLQGGQTGLFMLNQPGGEGIHMIILVSAVRLDCASSSVILDAAVIPITAEMLKNPEIEDFLLLLHTLEICSLDVDEEELKIWKAALPALSERCRTWEHVPSCEYKQEGAVIPLSLKPGEPVLCGCGKGQMPETFLGLPGWREAVSKHAVRVAISPAFSCPLVERTVDFAVLMPKEDEVPRCKACEKKEGDLEGGGEGLKRCTRCKGAWYCSAACQKKDWKTHKSECKEGEEGGPD